MTSSALAGGSAGKDYLAWSAARKLGSQTMRLLLVPVR